MPDETVLRGRQRQARDNDQRILTAAAELLTADHTTSTASATMADIAAAAGVGVASLYRRYADKDALMGALCVATMRQVETVARHALSDVSPTGLATFLVDAVTAGAGSLRNLAGTFTPDQDTVTAATTMWAALDAVRHAAATAGTLRPDVTTADLNHLVSMIHVTSTPADATRTRSLRRRYAHLLVTGLTARADLDPIPARAPTTDEVMRSWQPQPDQTPPSGHR